MSLTEEMATSSSNPPTASSESNNGSTGGTAKRKMESAGREMEELRRVQIANEGMRLLLNSRLREAEDIFRSSR